MGVTVEFADEVAGGSANAEIQGNRITIEKWNRNPVRALFGHEITHRIQELSADSYAEYKAAVQEVMGDRWTLELEATKALADQYGISYSEDQLADEVAADYAGELLQNDGTLEQFIQSAQSKPTLLQRIAQVFRDLVNKLRGTEKAQAERALGKLEKAYREAAQAEKSGGTNSESGEPRYSLKEYTDAEKKQHAKDAAAYFGTTYKWSETGYITADGRRLDFSGRHEGGPGGYRTVDHRDIRDALGDDYGGEDYSGSMVQFMSEGNIRISPESGGINLSVMPTKAQLETLSDLISKQRGEVILDIDTVDGNTVSSTEYPRGTHANKVLNDIKAYFEDGSTPRVSELAQFRYSLKGQGANDALVEKLTQQVRDGKITMEQALEQVRQDAADRTTAAELRSRKQLEQENDRLRERVSALKAQMKPTEQKTVRKADTDRVSREILKAYDSEADAESIRDQVKALGDYLVESGGGDDGVSWEGLMARALPLGREIVENARVLNDDMAKEYADLRSYLRETKLVISEQDSHDITDYNATRKALMGTVSLRKGENGNIEAVYADMAALWPEFFNTEAITNPAEMVEHIREVMDAIKPSYENPHSANLD